MKAGSLAVLVVVGLLAVGGCSSGETGPKDATEASSTEVSPANLARDPEAQAAYIAGVIEGGTDDVAGADYAGVTCQPGSPPFFYCSAPMVKLAGNRSFVEAARTQGFVAAMSADGKNVSVAFTGDGSPRELCESNAQPCSDLLADSSEELSDRPGASSSNEAASSTTTPDYPETDPSQCPEGTTWTGAGAGCVSDDAVGTPEALP